MSSRNNISIENNKKLFESRLQIKTNSSTLSSKNNKLSFQNKKNDSSNISFLNNSQPYTKIIFYKKKNNQSLLDNSYVNKNNSINKKIMNKKNRNKKQYITINTSLNKSNNIINDINFFGIKNSSKDKKKQYDTIININKRMSKQSSNNKSLNKKNKKNKIESITINIKNSKKKNNNNELNSFSTKEKRFIMISDINSNLKEYENNYKNFENNNKQLYKDKFISKFKLKKNKFKNSRNISRVKNNDNNYDSFLKILKYEKKSKLNTINNTYQNIVLKDDSNIKGGNSKKHNSKKGLEISITNLGTTKRKLFSGNYFGIYKNTYENMKCNNYKLNNNYSCLNKYKNIFKNDKKGNETNKNININININIKNNNLNKLLLKNKTKKISRNYKINNNKKYTYNELNRKNGAQKILSLKEPNKKTNLIANKFNENIIIKKNFQTIEINYEKINNKYIDKSEEIIEDNNNGTSTKTNDEFISERIDKKINDTSLKEDSGILSINEIEDIICYNDMKDINKKDNFLFSLDDKNNFIKKYKKKIYNLFFDNNDKENYIESKIKIKKKIFANKNEFNRDNKFLNSLNELKILHFNKIQRKKK